MGIESLRYLGLAGVKWELNDAPNIRMDEISSNQTARDESDKIIATAPVAVPAAAPVNANSAAANATKAATAAVDVKALYDAIAAFSHPLKMFAKNTVPPHFSRDNLLVITDAPSSDDEESGRILSGAPGELFDKMLEAINLSRDNIAICPLVFWRPPGGRTPTDEELAIARPFVLRMIELSQPRAILTLGTLAAGQSLAISRQSLVVSIPHPNYLLLKPDSKRAAWEELQKLKNNL